MSNCRRIRTLSFSVSIWLGLASSIVLFFTPIVEAAEADIESTGEGIANIGVAGGLNAGSLIQVFVALILVVLAIFALSVLLKKFNVFSSGSSDLIKVVAGLSLSNRDRLLLIQLGEEQILLSASPGSIKKLHHLATPLTVDSNGSQQNAVANSFSRIFGIENSKRSSS